MSPGERDLVSAAQHDASVVVWLSSEVVYCLSLLTNVLTVEISSFNRIDLTSGIIPHFIEFLKQNPCT